MASECADNIASERTLTSLCEIDSKIGVKASACLDAFASGKYESHVDGSERQQELAAATKGKADESLPEVYICRECDEGFLEEHNNKEACFHHPGRLMVNYQSRLWDDWHKWRDSVFDTEENQKWYSQGFMWDCCYEPGDGRCGCDYSWHEAKGRLRLEREETADEMPEPPETVDLTED